MLEQLIADFWFQELQPADWFGKDPALDQQIIARFLPFYQVHSFEAGQDKLPDGCSDSPLGYLAAILLFDQFPRHFFRGAGAAFAGDTYACSLCYSALEKGYDQQLTTDQRKFLYMPLQHAEDLAAQELSCRLFASLDADSAKYARQHQVIIARFGRFPHRNAALGRPSTVEELAFLEQPGSRF